MLKIGISGGLIRGCSLVAESGDVRSVKFYPALIAVEMDGIGKYILIGPILSGVVIIIFSVIVGFSIRGIKL